MKLWVALLAVGVGAGIFLIWHKRILWNLQSPEGAGFGWGDDWND